MDRSVPVGTFPRAPLKKAGKRDRFILLGKREVVNFMR